MWRTLKWGVAGAALGCVPGLLGLLAYQPSGHDWGPIFAIFLLVVLGPLGAGIGLIYGAVRVTGRAAPAVWFLLPALAGALAGSVLGMEPYSVVSRALFGDPEYAMAVFIPVLGLLTGLAGMWLYFRRIDDRHSSTEK
jgi:hypothetical protein